MLVNPHISSDREHFRDRLEGYLEAILKGGVRLRDWQRHEALPAFLARTYWFFETRIGRTGLLFMFARQDDEHTPTEIARHLDLVKREFDGIVAYSAERLTARFRARLIADGVAFAVPGNQLFIPELATDLREHFRGPRPRQPDRLSPSAQLVLFYHLLRGGQGARWTPTELVEPLGYSIMTMSRAFDELVTVGLARVERRGRRKFLSFRAEGQMLIDNAKAVLIRPERRLDHVGWLREPPELPLAGEHALSCFSDLSPPTAPPVYAVTAGQMRKFLSADWVELREGVYDADGTLATWRYDPRVLARNHVVDPLSLFAQFWEDPDERLSMAVDRLLEQWTW